ncbi:alpha/beta fold hydrolase [Pontiella sp.]|uniref:alpha/beta fold hydrolase n=1 Tax=Pontiella sp. TaxID=2837462 RepID=UPI0035613820
MMLLISISALLIGCWVISFLIEAVRSIPHTPVSPAWAKHLAFNFIEVNGVRMRFLKTGNGPPLVLLHTLRTQLDIFQHIIPALAEDFTVYAVDYPGHGYSDIPRTDYDPRFFIHQTEAWLAAMQIENALLVGESIGGAIGLELLARNHPRVRSVVAINSYDYGRGRGIMRGSLPSRIVFGLSPVPVVGAMVWRCRWFGAFKTLLKGSVHKPSALPPDLVQEMHFVGNRPGHYRAFMSLIDHFAEWEALRRVYPSITKPVTLLYGEFDWSTPAERTAACNLIPGAERVTVPEAGHLLSLEKPAAVIREIRKAAAMKH